MPEKPEVITVSRALKPKILGKKIKKCIVSWDNIIASPTVSEFIKNIKGQTIKSISTRGKFIVIELDTHYLLIHLRMEGKFTFRKLDSDVEKHEHVRIIFDDNTEMRYRDVRKFGKMYLIKKDELYKIKPLSLLGKEYNDKTLDSTYLLEKFKRRNKNIKTVLLDQSIITGIGNIYDDEILFLSHINPYKKASDLNKEECKLIIKNTKEVLNAAIKLGGTTIRSFTSEEGVHGLFQNKLYVHGKEGPCPVCGTEIIKEQINGRGTYYCPKCQK